MTSTREHIIACAEPVFDRHGFAGTGVDSLTAAAGVSSRTLYKHLGSKTGLVAAVLDARRERFARAFDVTTIDALFDALESWLRREGSRGCLFLRAVGEDAGASRPVAEVVAGYRELLHRTISTAVERETGSPDDLLAEQLIVLFEGATSAASYRGLQAVDAARSSARLLLAARG